MTTLVTGSHGCVGAWVLKTLVGAGERPVAYDLADDPWRLRQIAEPDEVAQVTFVRGDVTDGVALDRAIADHGVTRIIHLAAFQIPLCRQDPAKGALVNVVGTASVFEAAHARRDQVRHIAYASSVAVFGPASAYPPGPLRDDAPRMPQTHYGVYKVANEDTARIHWLEHGLASVGLRPDTIFGPGRDFGLTADPTIAMKATVLGRPFHIRWGGSRDFQYAADVARAFIQAAQAKIQGAPVYNLHGTITPVTEIIDLVRAAYPGATTHITYDAATQVPVVGAFDDSAFRRDVGPVPTTPLREGVRQTIERFERLLRAGRLDTRELT